MGLRQVVFGNRRRTPRSSASNASLMGTIRFGLLCMALLTQIILYYLLYRESTMPGLGLRYLMIPPLVLIGWLLVGGRYLQIGYELRRLGSALSYLVANLTAIGYPILAVSGGKAHLKPYEDDLIAIVGGPGYLIVQPGNVAVVENLRGAIRVLGPGRHLISRRETLKAALSLEEREAEVEKLSATTKDGISIDVKDVRYRYRLTGGNDVENYLSPTPDNPYPFSEDAVVNMTYNRNVTAEGVTTWHFGVNRVVDNVITDYVRTHHVDHLTAPDSEGDDPRGEIYQQFNSDKVKKQFLKFGAELLWIGIGHFDVPDKQVVEQRVNAWQVKWIGDAKIVRAFGESQVLAYQELGRAEAQAEMLMSIVHALEDVGRKQGDSQQHMRALYLARIAQLLDAMGKQYLPGQEGNQPKP